MSHKKILKLAIKFAQKIITSDYNNQEKEQFFEFFESFKKNFRALLNEMEGDYATIRIKGIDKNILKEFGNFYYNLLDLFKMFDDQHPKESIQRLISYVFTKSNKEFINLLNYKIQEFLKENEIDFLAGTKFSQVKINSFKNLVTLVTSAHKFLNNPTFVTTNLNDEKLKSETNDYTPLAGSHDTTKIERK